MVAEGRELVSTEIDWIFSSVHVRWWRRGESFVATRETDERKVSDGKSGDLYGR